MPTFYDTSFDTGYLIDLEQYGSSVGDVIYGWPSNGSSTYDPASNDKDYQYGWAKGGSDTSPSGNDKLYGGTGDDYQYGGTGNDVLYGGTGDDVLYGGRGNDVLYGGPGRDALYGGSGNDIFYSGTIRNDSSNVVIGGSGNDIFYGNYGRDIWYGEAGRDKYVLGDKDQVFYVQGSDYASISDFDKQNDSIQLYGSKDNYKLDGAFLYYKQPGDDELIAWVSYVTDLNLGGSYFDYVS